MRVFLNLCAGLDRLGIYYRVNEYQHIKKNPDELACVVGKPYVLDQIAWKNPILFGAAVYSHPLDDPQLFERLPIQKILVPGPWMKDMCGPYWGECVESWPVGIDTDVWRPHSPVQKSIDVLLYDKVRWEHDRYQASLIEPIRAMLRAHGHSYQEIRYGFYREEVFHAALTRCRSMIFLCEHETQGIAYQQALSCGVPILAWDRGGFWQDPAFYPHRIRFAPVSSVPYWDNRCGVKFESIKQFDGAWCQFWDAYQSGCFDPRSYILENLTLEKCAEQYMQHVHRIT
jgi:glycosyltransferase involved in cell wall biosynthesis